MQQIHIQLEDWQKAALSEMADARGIEVETLARSILSERLVERIHTTFDDLMCGEAFILSTNHPNQLNQPNSDTIEQRLRRLFET